MSQLNSSTSNSDLTMTHPLTVRSWRDMVSVLGWTLLGLVLIDLAMNLVVVVLERPPTRRPHPLVNYLEYGRSIEGKVRRLVGPTEETTGPLAYAGWIPLQQGSENDLPVEAELGDDLLVSFYGMSFSDQIATATTEVDPAITVRMRGGPAAPANHSLATYLEDRNRAEPDAVVLGVLASSVRGIETVTGMTWMFENPAPFCYPRYINGDRAIEKVETSVRDLEELREVINDPDRFEVFVNELAVLDRVYSPFYYKKNWLDHSAIFRLIRRATWGALTQRRLGQVHGPQGFNANSSAIGSLQAIVRSFAREVRHDGRLPVVVLIEDQGYDNHLSLILEPILEELKIPYISTHRICDPNEPQHFKPDRHFKKPCNTKIAQALSALIRAELGVPSVSNPTSVDSSYSSQFQSLQISK